MEGASLVIPAYNERNRIETCLRSVAEWVRSRPGGWDWEVILVDDGSSDGTQAAARQLAGQLGLPLQILTHRNNRGKGAALRTGVLASCGDPVLLSDADLSTPLTEWVKLAERLPTHPIAIGSRGLGEDLVRVRQPLYRRLLGKAGNLLVRMLAVPGIRDTQCGFKLFRGDIARDLFRRARIDGFAYDMEILYLARLRGLAIAEVPVLWFNSPDSKVSLVRDALPTLWDLLRLRWLHRRVASTLPEPR
ncbi:MAG TPA: dolichyl-phosphate beta-glucosyltransferase [Thermoanaerobaculia bacterium]|jgi:dolichyl-phosphate beta-glucosyltransferase